MCMQNTNDNVFLKKIKQVEMLWTDIGKIPANIVLENDVRKISKVKSYNLGTSVAGKTVVYMSDSFCVCNKCRAGKVLNCIVEQNGSKKIFDLEKQKKKID